MQVIDGLAVLKHPSAKMEKRARSGQQTASCLPTYYPTDNPAQHRSQPGDDEHGFDGQIVVGDVDSGAEERDLTESVDANAAEYGEKEKCHIVERRTLRAEGGIEMDSQDASTVAGVNLREGRVSMEMGVDRNSGVM